MQNWRSIISTQAAIQLTAITILSVVMLLLTGCTPPGVTTLEKTGSILPVADSTQLPQVITNLMQQADQQYMQGNYNESLATLERAVRIKPRYPEVWSRMAQIYLLQGQYQQAKQHAQRSNNYIKNNLRLKQFNDQLIETSQTGGQH